MPGPLNKAEVFPQLARRNPSNGNLGETYQADAVKLICISQNFNGDLASARQIAMPERRFPRPWSGRAN